MAFLLFVAAVFSWWSAAHAATSATFDRGVNIELWANPALGSPAERINRARAAGFNFVRLGVPINAWFAQGTEKQQAEILRIVDAAVSHTLASHMTALVTLFPVGGPQGLRPGIIVCGSADDRNNYQRAVGQVLGLLPDSESVAFEPLNEPPGGCIRQHVGIAFGADWAALQLEIYKALRKEKPKIGFVVNTGNWSQLDGILAFDPRQYSQDQNTFFTFHYYEPKLFTHQAVTYGTKVEEYARGVPWPIEANRLSTAEADTIMNVRHAGMAKREENAVVSQIQAEFVRYREEGTMDYLKARFRSIAGWAATHGIDQRRVLLGEFGIARPTHSTLGKPYDDAGRYLLNVRAVADEHRFRWAIWDLDGGYAVLCGTPPQLEVCSTYRPALTSQ
jgi:hypothetical protein